MKSIIEERVSQLLASDRHGLLRGCKIGLEKESLRVAIDGCIAQTHHPRGLGSALTHPHITTDYSEALLELVTPPFAKLTETLQFLDDTHRFVYSQLGDEILWATSMPCVVAGEESIRIAEYGTSNAAKMKTAYRRGLGHRYGRVMQAIAGIHYNYSYPSTFWRRYQALLGDARDSQTFISESYIGMVRNLLRYGWLVPYLFGASPAVCRSFLDTPSDSLCELFEHTYYGPYATSLRMSDIGYQNNGEGEAGIAVNHNSLPAYIDSLTHAINTPCDRYKKIVLCRDGEWQQLNHNILQIENEHYSTVRPKPILQGEEKPTLALARRGVAYIEMRSLDVNPYEPLGISEESMRFLESFFLFSLLASSAPISDIERVEIQHNLNAVAQRGRDPQLQLSQAGNSVSLRDWANDIFEQLESCCALLDSNEEQPLYCAALQRQREKIADPNHTPSARVLAEMMENREEFFNFALRLSKRHQQSVASRPLPVHRRVEFESLAHRSIDRQREIEHADTLPFKTFLQDYFQQS